MKQFVPCEVTPDQIKKWNETRAALIWHCPAFTHIFYSMMNKNGYEHLALFTREDVPVAATDGSHILINPDTFFAYNLQERIFVVAHEISHGIFGHMDTMHKLQAQGCVKYPDGVELSYDHDDMNRAMDYVINDMLIESKIGAYNSNWLHDTTIATHNDSVMTAYRRIHQDKQNGGKGGASGTGFDNHMAPGSTTGQTPQQAQRNPVEWATAIAGAIASARAQGKLPAAMDRALSEVLEPVVDWTDKIVSFFARKPGGGSYDWRKPDRRLITRNIIAPARMGYGCGPVVVAIDTSGSVWNIIEKFFAEVYGILEDVRPSKIYLMFCDASVGRVDEIEDASDLLTVRNQKAPGGGGTSFIPVFEEIEKMGIEPDALLYLTDGMGSFPDHAPAYPVLWGNIYPASQYPFGTVVDVPLK